MITHKATFLQLTNQESISEFDGFHSRQLNVVPKFNVAFTAQSVYLG
jgi:hypothetical protein